MKLREYWLSEMPIELGPTAVRSGRIPAVRVGVTIRFDEAEIEKFIAAKLRIGG